MHTESISYYHKVYIYINFFFFSSSLLKTLEMIVLMKLSVKGVRNYSITLFCGSEQEPWKAAVGNYTVRDTLVYPTELQILSQELFKNLKCHSSEYK